MVDVEILEDPSDPEAQIEQMIHMLHQAHEGIPLIEMLTDSRESVKHLWFRLGVLISLLEGKVWVVYDPEDEEREGSGRKIVSALFGFGPGKVPMGSEAQRAINEASEFEKALSPEARKWQKEVYDPASKQLKKDWAESHKIKDGWLPIMVATDPEHQRKGYGSALIRTLQQQAREDHADVALTTFSDELESYYSGLGFRTQAECKIESPLGTWVHRLMSWEDDTILPKIDDK